jgi:hypothetical protein
MDGIIKPHFRKHMTTDIKLQLQDISAKATSYCGSKNVS